MAFWLAWADAGPSAIFLVVETSALSHAVGAHGLVIDGAGVKVKKTSRTMVRNRSMNLLRARLVLFSTWPASTGCSQVFEHVFTPETFMSEIYRVLCPGGRLLLTVPFASDEHEQPHDFARYASLGLRALLERAGFEVAEQRKSVAGSRALLQLWCAHLCKITRSDNRGLNFFAQLVVIAPFSLAGILPHWAGPNNADFYLDSIVLARKPVSLTT
jgi:SAM-dependent methyltransferase